MENVIVTIARQYGSGGKTIGEMYAKDQGINCYSREILRMASDDSGINEMLFNQADERLKGTTLFGWAKKVYKGDLIPPESDDFVSDRNLFNYQAKVIKQLAAQRYFWWNRMRKKLCRSQIGPTFWKQEKSCWMQQQRY